MLNRAPLGWKWSSLLIVLAGAAPLLAWLTWDKEYYWDETIVTPQGTYGAWQGPYETWQVIGCAITFIVLIAACAWRWGSWPTVALAPVGATAAWLIPTLPDLGGGLALVGAVLMYVGGLVGTALICAIVAMARRARGEGKRPEA